jgi:citrate lyase subunit beta/citryl-CoA lyase
MTLNRPPQPPLRSLLYVPGNKLDWMLKAPSYGADALIFDLEDSVPPNQKPASRQTVRKAIDEVGKLGRPRLFVRINAVATGMAEDDLEAIVAPGLFGIQAPKIEGPEAIHQLDQTLAKLEQRAGLPPGQIFIMPLIESAEGVRLAYDIAMAAARVGYLMGAAGGSVGDMAQSVGYRESSGMETAYIFGKIVVDARAAGITNPCSGLVTDPIRDLDAVRARATRARNFGYMGANLIHPSHVQLANEVFGPSKEDVVFWKGLVEAVEEGERRGTSAVVYQGRMMDIAHMAHARNMLRLIADHPELDPANT